MAEPAVPRETVMSLLRSLQHMTDHYEKAARERDEARSERNTQPSRSFLVDFEMVSDQCVVTNIVGPFPGDDAAYQYAEELSMELTAGDRAPDWYIVSDQTCTHSPTEYIAQQAARRGTT